MSQGNGSKNKPLPGWIARWDQWVVSVEFYNTLADQKNLDIRTSPTAGLLPDFNSLSGDRFDASKVDPGIRDFYQRTSGYFLEAWSEAPILSRFFLWALTKFVSRQMDQLNFPVSSLELAEGMTSDVLPMFDRDGQLRYTGWLRRLANSNRVIYTGLYSIQRPASFPDPCVKVSFPLPLGSATVFLRPENQDDGSFKLISSGSRFGDPGFYRMVDSKGEYWKVRYIRTLRQEFHVYVDKLEKLRTEHLVRFMGLTVLRLHYKLVKHQG